jgi:hypothetical protein
MGNTRHFRKSIVNDESDVPVFALTSLCCELNSGEATNINFSLWFDPTQGEHAKHLHHFI